MKEQTKSMSELLDNVDINEIDRAVVKAQVQRVEAVLDTVAAFCSVLGRPWNGTTSTMRPRSPRNERDARGDHAMQG